MGTKDPKRDGQNKQGEVPLVQGFEEKKMEGKIKPDSTMLESSPVGTGAEAPKQWRLLLMNMQRTTACMSTAADDGLETGGVLFFDVVVGVKPDKPTQLAAFQEIIVLPIGWQQRKVVELDNKQEKLFHLSG